MKMLAGVYSRVIDWSERPQAFYYLLFLSFSEASFFPVPPDVLLLPMTLARPKQGWRYALWTTLFSAFGGMLGYAIGLFAIHLIYPYFVAWGYASAYTQAVHWFQYWGVFALIIAGFTPVPYKLFTIAGGALQLPILPFLLGCIVGRGGRFFLEVVGVKYFGRGVHQWLLRYIDYIGWLCIAGLFVILWWKFVLV